MVYNVIDSVDVKENKIRTKDIELKENLSFDELLLSKSVLEGLKDAGFLKPSPIQFKAIPLGKLGLDLIVQAKSGTGKTCVFTVISLEHILLSNSKALQVLILAPTREVAIQIRDVFRSVTKASLSHVKCHALIGGQSVNDDKNKLKSCQVVIGTPGRILHLMNENILNASSIRLFILDEADKLLSCEFQEDINLIYSKLPENKQLITLSATYPSYMASSATRYMRSPTFVRLNIIDPSLRGIKQYFKITPYSSMSNVLFDYKIESLIKILSTNEFNQSIIFTNYQLKAQNLCNTLNSKGFPAIFISGNIDQAERNKAIEKLRQNKCRILVSTDLTARGIDAQNVDLIICMDLPSDPETYLHRIGRAGRYGALGTAISFVSEKDELAQFENLIDSYSLRVTQFDDDLNDLVSLRNFDLTNDTRIDDFTIEKVNLSKEELDKSLFEYENLKKIRNKAIMKCKLEKKSLKTEKHEFAQNLEELKRLNVIRFTDIDEIRRDLSCFKLRTKEIEEDLKHYESIQNAYKSIEEKRRVKSLDLESMNEILKERNAKENGEIKIQAESSVETMKPLSWESVVIEEVKNPDSSDSSELFDSTPSHMDLSESNSQDDPAVIDSKEVGEQIEDDEEVAESAELDENDDEYSLIYSYYHNYYYNYFLNELLLNN